MSEQINQNSVDLPRAITKKDLENLKKTINKLRSKYELGTEEVLSQLDKYTKTTIPTSIFSKQLSALETITKYLHENKKITLAEIAEMTNRTKQNIYTTYKNAIKKHKDILEDKKSRWFLTADILQDKKLAVLEAIVEYMHEELGLDIHEISKELNRNYKTIWTVYSRAKNKRRQHDRKS